MPYEMKEKGKKRREEERRKVKRGGEENVSLNLHYYFALNITSFKQKIQDCP